MRRVLWLTHGTQLKAEEFRAVKIGGLGALSEVLAGTLSESEKMIDSLIPAAETAKRYQMKLRQHRE
jgi:hypothetical protein|eukprot:COSAG01_NODE_44936_length_414_cov_0.771429_1_plen_67_part_00